MAILCEACNRKFYESVIRECPKKPGHYICLYCCHKCKRQYKGIGGTWGCRAWDEAKAAQEAAAREKKK